MCGGAVVALVVTTVLLFPSGKLLVKVSEGRCVKVL